MLIIGISLCCVLAPDSATACPRCRHPAAATIVAATFERVDTRASRLWFRANARAQHARLADAVVPTRRGQVVPWAELSAGARLRLTLTGEGDRRVIARVEIVREHDENR